MSFFRSANGGMSTEDFLREVVFGEKKKRLYRPEELPDAPMSTADFLRKLVFGEDVPPDAARDDHSRGATGQFTEKGKGGTSNEERAKILLSSVQQNEHGSVVEEAEKPGFVERNAPFWSAHKNEAVRQGIIDMVRGRKEEGTQRPEETRLRNKDSPSDEERKKALIQMMAKELESWGRNMLGGHSIVINARTRGISDAIINKNATKMRDAVLQDIMEEAMKAGKAKKK